MAEYKATNRQLDENRCVIIGAGIAGLTAALALEQFGFSVVVLEKSVRLEEVGAGLQLSPNATSVLAKLGVLETLLPTATSLVSIDLVSARSAKPLLSLKTASLATESAPFLAVHRADLQASLLCQVQASPSIEIQLDAKLSGHQLKPDCVEVNYQIRDEGRVVSAHCLVGADGVRSALRQSANGAKAQFSGYIAQRQTIDRSKLTSASLTVEHAVKAFVSTNAHLVAYPISGGKQINLVFITKQPEQNGQTPAPQPAPKFSGFTPQLVQDLSRHSDWTSWPIHTVDGDASWHLDERTILIGDAAHAMLPFGAQGAAMAIEDAYTLAYCLAKGRESVRSAMEGYEILRRKRIKRVAERGKLNAFAYHASGPVALARDLVFATKGQRLMRDLEWLYAYRVPGLKV